MPEVVSLVSHIIVDMYTIGQDSGFPTEFDLIVESR